MTECNKPLTNRQGYNDVQKKAIPGENDGFFLLLHHRYPNVPNHN